MTPEQQRIAIAEACGWKYNPTAAPDMKYVGIMCWIRPGNDSWQTEQVPDYLNDLNAMHEAEKTLHNRLGLWWTYLDTLDKVAVDLHPLGCGSQVHATASQRAEAFLRTLNLLQLLP